MNKKKIHTRTHANGRRRERKGERTKLPLIWYKNEQPNRNYIIKCGLCVRIPKRDNYARVQIDLDVCVNTDDCLSLLVYVVWFNGKMCWGVFFLVWSSLTRVQFNLTTISRSFSLIKRRTMEIGDVSIMCKPPPHLNSKQHLTILT